MDANKKISRWYFGGVSAAMASCVTHPLDLLKVHMQTHTGQKISVVQTAANVVRHQGFLKLYNGLTASLCRQLTHSTTRFAIYGILKQNMSKCHEPNLPMKMGMAAISGAAGGLVGTPADIISIRMQNDVKLPLHKRRNYKHVFDGLRRVYKDEGFRKLFSGASMASTRSMFLTTGQLAFYDQVKISLLNHGFSDNPNTHFMSSFVAGAIATTLTQPVDVLKTRAMVAKPGKYSSILSLIHHTGRKGLRTFFKGYIFAFLRLGPQTILTFMFLEQLRMRYGYYPTPTECVYMLPVKN